MLVVTANWALTDGSLAASRARRAAAWLEVIRRAIVRAGMGRDGRYRPVAEATLIMAGDTFDWLLSDVWTGPERPWHAGRRSAEARDRVAAATIRAALPAVRIIRRWIRQGIPLPAADARGRPSAWASSCCRFSGVLLAGDRDRWLTDLAAAGDRVGLLLGEEWSDGIRHVRHGHDLDPLAHGRDSLPVGIDRPPTLAESLTIDLVVAFAAAVRDDVALWKILRPRLGELSSAGPVGLPAGIAALVPEVTSIEAAIDLRTRLSDLWRRSVDRWHAIATRDMPTCEAEFDALGDLAAWLGDRAPLRPPPAALARLGVSLETIRGSTRHVVGHAAVDQAPAFSCHLADLSWQ
ncbi:MAG: hypothetical protein ACKOCX_09370, partial [Planctomycetota bacterium]